jgi:hypothetical protein
VEMTQGGGMRSGLASGASLFSSDMMILID